MIRAVYNPLVFLWKMEELRKATNWVMGPVVRSKMAVRLLVIAKIFVIS